MKKKFLSTLLMLCVLSALAAALPTAANAATSGIFTYEVIDGAAKITGCDASFRSVIIPDTLEGYPVTSIGGYAFQHHDMEYVTIPGSVTSIGEWAFYQCENLISVTIPDNITSIGAYTFSGCKSLTGITIPDGVTTIGNAAFEWCESFTNITIPDSVTSIGNSAFRGCKGLTSVTIPDSVTTIGNAVFMYCYGLISVSIPGSITNITTQMFQDCTSLTNITIPDSVTSIENGAFKDCTGLVDITIPDSVTSIGNNTFEGCESLPGITLPGSIISIGNEAFTDCTGLAEIVIPNGVTSIGSNAFEGCESLPGITLPGSVVNIGPDAFYNTAYYNEKTNWKDGALYIDGCLLDTDNLLPEQYHIIENTRIVADRGFYNCSSLTSVTIPDSVTHIGDYAFYGCNELSDIYYAGSREQWEHINIGYNPPLADAVMHYAAYLSYNVNGVLWKTEKVATDSDAPITTETPTRLGYAFLGWATAPDAAAEYRPGGTIPIGTESITLYAVWERSSHTTTTEINGIFMVAPTGVPAGSSVILACYKNGALVHTGKYEYDGSTAIPFFVDAAYDEARVFVWDFAAMLPITEPETVL